MAKQRTKRAAGRYEVLVPCSDYKKDAHFQVGDTVTADDFSKVVIASWLEKGVLREADNGSVA